MKLGVTSALFFNGIVVLQFFVYRNAVVEPRREAGTETAQLKKD